MISEIREREERLKEEGEEGFTLVESMVALLIVTLLFLFSIGVFSAIKEKSASEALVRTVQAATSEARGRSIGEGVKYGIAFKEESDRVYITIYKDDDFDGITKEDIEKSIDKPISLPELLTKENAQIAIPEGVEKDPSGKNLSGNDPIMFGKGDILTFSPKGTATPGTLYIKEGSGGDGWAIRVTGIDGRIRVYKCKNKNWLEYERW